MFSVYGNVRIFLPITPYIKVSLCILLPTNIQTCTNTLSLAGPCLTPYMLSIRNLLLLTAGIRRLWKPQEFMVAYPVCKQVIDLGYNLCMIAFPIEGPSQMLGDIGCVTTPSTSSYSTIKKRLTILSHHCSREYIASNYHYVLNVE
jgi:hypothetical protein